MENNLKTLHRLLKEGKTLESQDVFRKLLARLPDTNDVLARTYLFKAYEINTKQRPYEGLTATQLEAHSLIVRQLLIDNSEELDRRLSRVL